MKVVVIVPDRNITVDNRMLVLDQQDWNFDDSHIHAIHWDETSGELEYVDTSANEQLTTIDLVQPYIDKFFEELPRIEKIRIQREEESLAARESREQRMREEEEEQDRILQKIRETAEENRRLKEQASIAFEREQEAKRKQDELEKQIAFQDEIDRKKAIRESIDLEIANKVRLFDEDIKQKKEELKSVEEDIVTKQQSLENTFNNKLADLFDQRGSMLSMIDDERAELDKQRREYLESKRKQDELDELMREELNVRSETLRLERENDQKALEAERESLEASKVEAIRFRDELHALAEHQTDSHNAEVQEWQRERELEEERLRVEEENLQIRKKQLELERREYEENLATYNAKERNLETILENEQEIYEARLYEEKARMAADKLFDEHQRNVLETEALNKQSEMIEEISATSDPFTLFSVLDLDNFDVKNLPVTEIIMFFSKLKRLQTFCQKYDLTWTQIKNDPELQERIEDFLAEGIEDPNKAGDGDGGDI